MKPTYIDLFCGMGGFSYGFKQAGFKHLLGVDIWDKACKVYEKNVGHAMCIDIYEFEKKLNKLDLHPDVVIGSPPCQDFSVLNKSLHTRFTSLSEMFKEIVYKFEPKIWIMENVPSMFDDSDALYKYVFDMSEYGLLQKRKRFFGSNIKIDLKKIINKFLNLEQSNKLIKFRNVNIHRSYQTITGRYNSFSKTNPCVLDDNRLRLLNHKEALQIQTFPFDYKLVKGLTQRDKEQMIGNAVPPAFAYLIAKEVRRSIKYETKE